MIQVGDVVDVEFDIDGVKQVDGNNVTTKEGVFWGRAVVDAVEDGYVRGRLMFAPGRDPFSCPLRYVKQVAT